MVNISLNDTDMTAFGVHDTLGRLPSDLGVLTAKQGSLGRKPAADRTLRVSGCSAAGGLTPVTRLPPSGDAHHSVEKPAK